MRTLRASEIGTYLYCRRAWWYRRKGYPSENRAELSAGLERHRRHGRAVWAAGCQRIAAYALLALALALLAAHLTGLGL